MSRHIIALQIFAAFSQEFASSNRTYQGCLNEFANMHTWGDFDDHMEYTLHNLEKLISEIQF